MRRSSRRSLRLAALIAMAGLAAGCGGSEGNEGNAPLSKAEFIERANAACERERRGLEKRVAEFLARQEGSKPPKELYTDLAHFVLLPTIESEMEAIRMLPVAPREAGAVNRLLYTEQLALDTLANTSEIESREAVERSFAESARELRAYGLAACTNGPGRRAL